MRRSFTEIVSHPTQHGVLSQGYCLASRLSLHLKESPFILWDSLWYFTGNTWSFTVRNLSPDSSRCSRFPDVGRHKRDRGSHWYVNTWVSCLCVGRNGNLGTAALKGIQIREKCDMCRLPGVVVFVRCVPVR